MKRDNINSAIAAILILVFSYAAISKMIDIRLFVAQLDGHPLLRSVSKWLSWGLPIVELLTCSILAISKTQLIGLYAAGGLLTSFTLYLGIMLLSGNHLPCSCGGIINKLSWRGHLLLNIGLLALSVWGITRYSPSEYKGERRLKKHPS